MIDTTMVVVFVQGKETDRMAKVQHLRRLLGQYVSLGYDADFEGVPTVSAQDNHGHWNHFEPKPGDEPPEAA